MSKYQKLTDHLLKLQASEWRASFSDIEQILGFKLPPSAYEYPAWWANQAGRQSQSSSWQAAGWNTENLDLVEQRVTFSKEQNAFARYHASNLEGANAFGRIAQTQFTPSYNAFAAPRGDNREFTAAEQNEQSSLIQPLTIAQAKAGLAAHFGVPTDNIQIVITG